MPHWILQTFRLLLLSPAFTLLESIVARSTSLEMKDKTLTLRFEHPELDLTPQEIFCIEFEDKPSTFSRVAMKTPTTASESLDAILSIAPLWSFGDIGETGQIVLSDGKNGTLHCLGADGWNERRTQQPYSPDIFTPIDIDLQAYVFQDSQSKEFVLYDEVLETCSSQDPMEIFLGLVYERVS